MINPLPKYQDREEAKIPYPKIFATTTLATRKKEK